MKRGLVVLLAVVVLLGGGYGIFAAMSGGGGEKVALSTASPATVPSGASLDGTWTVRASDSFVGYRVREKLAMLPAPSEAVGRTSAVEGSMTIAGLSVTRTDVRADLRRLSSDSDRRDARIREIGLESDRFPEARFVLSGPITFTSKPDGGTKIDTTASGKLTIHGVTKDVRVPLQAQWTDGVIEVAGSIPIQFQDYGMDAIRTGPVVTEDNGTMEFQLFFVPS